MKISHAITIESDINTVWPFVADPVMQSLWNPKIVAVDRISSGPVTAGETFQCVYEMNQRERTTNVTVPQCQPPRTAVFDHQMIWKQKEQHHIETYQLTEEGQSVHVLQTIEISLDNLPWIARLLIRFISRFGQSQGTQPLDALKSLIENLPAV